jgi:hypothetical protein
MDSTRSKRGVRVEWAIGGLLANGVVDNPSHVKEAAFG